MDAEDLKKQREQKVDTAAIAAKKSGTGMTLRERFQRAMHFQTPDRLPHFEFGYWDQTLPVWHQQGLPKDITDEASAYAYFGIENWSVAPVNNYISPVFEAKVLSEDERHRVIQDWEGVTCEVNKSDVASIPHYLEFPIKTMADWKEYKKRLDPRTPGRYPANWKEIAEAYRHRDFPLGIGIGSMLGWPRNWIGFENASVAFYEQPEMMRDMIDHLGDFMCAVIEPALKDVQFDFASGWEDICFKNGPMISPKMFREYVLPQYKKITRLLRRYGVDVAMTDCDGDISLLVPLFLEGGINCMFPIEVGGGTDPVDLRKKYGKDILLWGGVDKVKMQKPKAVIDAELERLAPFVKEGGFLPGFDHRCPPTVPLENYRYYLKRKKELFGC